MGPIRNRHPPLFLRPLHEGNVIGHARAGDPLSLKSPRDDHRQGMSTRYGLMESPQKGSHFGSHPHLLGTACAQIMSSGLAITNRMSGASTKEISTGQRADFPASDARRSVSPVTSPAWSRAPCSWDRGSVGDLPPDAATLPSATFRLNSAMRRSCRFRPCRNLSETPRCHAWSRNSAGSRSAGKLLRHPHEHRISRWAHDGS
jgi:hypothetical protein